jgi:amidase
MHDHAGDSGADATTLASEVRAGRVPARALVDDALGRIAAHTTNAVVTVCGDEARLAADRIDAMVARGEDPGALAGVPFTAKDTVATAGQRATGGSLLLADNVAADDAEVVARLRAAGAVLVGKTNCPEFALQPRTVNRVFGATLHPFDPKSSPGGSSGGCAAAVAGGLVSFSIGGDYGGSIRYPAACTGIYGLRPSRGAVPTRGHVPEPAPGSPRERFQTLGPLARTARDIQLVFDVIAGRVPAPARAGGSERVGIVRGGWTCTSAVNRAVDAMADRLALARYDVVDVDPAPFVAAAGVFDSWRATDDYADLRALAAGRETELTAHIARLVANAPVPAADLHERLAGVVRAVALLLETTPVVVLPVGRVGVVALDATSIEIEGGAEGIDALQFLAPSRAVSVLGLPALAVPAGLDDRGMPVGVQLVGREGAEAALVALATDLASQRT